jgi:hypothetical protein
MCGVICEAIMYLSKRSLGLATYQTKMFKDPTQSLLRVAAQYMKRTEQIFECRFGQ